LQGASQRSFLAARAGFPLQSFSGIMAEFFWILKRAAICCGSEGFAEKRISASIPGGRNF
jgi:hypothetical protein